jgi:hypothetical protein
MKFTTKAISAFVLTSLFVTSAFADLNGSVEIKDDEGNTIGTSRMIQVETTSVELRNQLSENDQNFIKYSYDKMSDSDKKLMKKLNQKIDDYVYFKSNTAKKRILDNLVEGLEQEIFSLVMSYPADAAMNKEDTRKYLLLNTLKLETYAKSW